MLTYNHSVLTNNGSWLTDGSVTPPVPSDEVTIGTQTWKKYNLNIDDGLGGILSYHVGIVNGFDYGTRYYYNRDAAERIAASIQGWHLPSKAEWETLCGYGLSNIKSSTGWNSNNGNDIYGFTLTPDGLTNSGGVQKVGEYGYYWTSTSINTYNYFLYCYMEDTSPIFGYSSSTYYAVRLIKD